MGMWLCTLMRTVCRIFQGKAKIILKRYVPVNRYNPMHESRPLVNDHIRNLIEEQNVRARYKLMRESFNVELNELSIITML